MTLPEVLSPEDGAFLGDPRRVLEEKAFRRLGAKLEYLPNEERVLIWKTALYLIHKFAAAGVADRDSGRSASCHSIDTAAILADMHLPVVALQMGLLHDVVEDASHGNDDEAAANLAEIKENFGDEIADGVNSLGIIKLYGHEESLPGVVDDESRDQELRARFFEAIIHNPLVAFVRLAERWQNLQEIEPRYKKHPTSAIRTCEETIAVYAPMAWEMGLYKIANSMAEYSLKILCPEGMKKLTRMLPAFSEKKSKTARTYLKDQFEIPEEKYRVFPPSYYQLARLANEKKIKRRQKTGIVPELVHKDWESSLREVTVEEVPILVDVLVATDDELGTYADRIIRNGLFYRHDRTLRSYFTDREEGGKRAYYLQVAAKERKYTPSSPIRIAFMQEKEWNYRRASLFHLYQTTELVDLTLISVARRRMEELYVRFQRLQASEQETPQRATIYEAEEHGELMMVRGIIDKGDELIYINIFAEKKSTVLDIAAKILTPEEFLCCQSIFVNKKPVDLSQTALADSEVTIKIDSRGLWHIKPSWLDALRKASNDIRQRMTGALTDIINGVYILSDGPLVKSARKYQREVIREARARGEGIFRRRYKDRYRTEKRLRVIRGFDEVLKTKYGDSAGRFYQDVGIDLLPYETVMAVVDRLWHIRENLLPVRINIPVGFEKRSGWGKIATAVLAELGFSIVEGSIEESDEEKIGGILIYRVEPVKPMTADEVQLTRGEIVNVMGAKFREEFPDAPGPRIYFRE